jgi:hypothetical protein
MANKTLKPYGSTIPYAEPLWYSRNVTPHYKESHRRLRDDVRKYIDNEIMPHAFEWETAGIVPDWVRLKACPSLTVPQPTLYRHGSATPSLDSLP